MNTAEKKEDIIKVTVTIDVTVDPEWIDYITQNPDIFMRDYCGYWMYGMERDKELGWLAHEHDETRTTTQVARSPEYNQIVADWRAGKPLPESWYRLDKAACVKAWAEGVKIYGVDWYENGDANTYDCAIQMALLGELRYG